MCFLQQLIWLPLITYHHPSRFQVNVLTSAPKYRKHPKPPSQKVMFFWEALSSKADLMAGQADPPEAKCLYLDRLSFISPLQTGLRDIIIAFYFKVSISTRAFSEKNTFSFGAMWDSFLKEPTAFISSIYFTGIQYCDHHRSHWPLFKTLLTTIEHYAKHYRPLVNATGIIQNTIDHHWPLF